MQMSGLQCSLFAIKLMSNRACLFIHSFLSTSLFRFKLFVSCLILFCFCSVYWSKWVFLSYGAGLLHFSVSSSWLSKRKLTLCFDLTGIYYLLLINIIFKILNDNKEQEQKCLFFKKCILHLSVTVGHWYLILEVLQPCLLMEMIII